MKATDFARLKVEWAERHLEALWLELDGFMKLHCNVVNELRYREALLKLSLTQPLPEHWGLMIGDFLHNLRSALDHLIWRLVQHNGQIPGPNNEFPVFLKQSGFDKRGPEMLRGVHPGAIDLIQTLQPFAEGGKGNLLWILNLLNNIDKHRVLHVTQVYLVSAKPIIKTPDHSQVEIVRLLEHCPTNDGDVIAHVRWPNFGGKAHVEVNAKLDVVFPPGVTEGYAAVIELLRTILTAVKAILARFDESLIGETPRELVHVSNARGEIVLVAEVIGSGTKSVTFRVIQNPFGLGGDSLTHLLDGFRTSKGRNPSLCEVCGQPPVSAVVNTSQQDPDQQQTRYLCEGHSA